MRYSEYYYTFMTAFGHSRKLKKKKNKNCYPSIMKIERNCMNALSNYIYNICKKETKIIFKKSKRLLE